jgi:hypothetical protein
MPAPHPPTLSRRSRRMLARLLRRRARRHDRPPHWNSASRRPVGLSLWLLSWLPSERMHRRHRGDLRPSPQRLRSSVANVLSKGTEADFQAWRDQREWTAEKYRRFDRHERMSPRPARKKRLDGMNDRGLETTLRRSNTVAARSPPRHPWGRQHLHHEAS